MLPSSTVLAQNIKGLSPTTSASTGMMNLTAQIADFMDQVQATGGSSGIFALAQSVTASALAALPPVSDSSWISGFADAIESGINAAVITPGTVMNPAWLGSGNLDVMTSPSASSTITTIAAAKAQLISDLQNATATNNPPFPLAQAISDATLKFMFLCIGLGPPPSFTPIPLPLSAE